MNCMHAHSKCMVRACKIVPRTVNVVTVLQQDVFGVQIWYNYKEIYMYMHVLHVYILII